ncbi:threonine aldolase family protein [Thalassobius sp. MITS945101]|uniref:threonine aldolase family protein n=1 Tax=Thalassobius sp. MITS945101 TaxID=3096994 RepID=UPI00399A20FB
MKYRIDLISDTSTRPSAGMLAAMAEAETGDEQRGEDPTTLALCAEVARMLGMEDAIFLPSGTMCNQIAFLVHCRPGDEILAAGNSHIFRSEGAGAAALASAQIATIPTDSGIFTAEDVTARLRAPRDRAPVSRLISVEQTTNSGGGAIWPLDVLAELRDLAAKEGLILHMDGARLMNAAVGADVPAVDFCQGFESAWIDLSKGLGCPVGAVLAGSHEFIRRAWVWKHRLGGAMRQSGVLAAAGLYALAYNLPRLEEDHAKARRFTDLLQGAQGLVASPRTPETNIAFVDVSASGQTTAQIAATLAQQGIRLNAEGPERFRVVTHLDVTLAEVEEAAAALITATRS